jgi:hypothetical protein
MANYRTPFYKIGMASTPLYQEKKDDYNPNTGEEITNESTTSVKTVINGRKGTLTTSKRNFKSPGNSGGNTNTGSSNDGGKSKMSNSEWTSFVKANPDWNKGSNRAAKREMFVPDPETPLELPPLAKPTPRGGLGTDPIPPLLVPINTGFDEEGGFGGSNIPRFNPDKEEGGGNLFKTTKALKIGCPGGCPGS